jgi:hypothetical protein
MSFAYTKINIACALAVYLEMEAEHITEELMKHAGFLIPADEWEYFEQVAKEQDLDRSQLLRKFIRQQTAKHRRAQTKAAA